MHGLHKRGMKILLGFTTFTVLAWILGWFLFAYQLRQAVEEQCRLLAQSGWDISLGTAHLEGFPFSMDWRYDDPHAAMAQTGWKITAEQIRIQSSFPPLGFSSLPQIHLIRSVWEGPGAARITARLVDLASDIHWVDHQITDEIAFSMMAQDIETDFLPEGSGPIEQMEVAGRLLERMAFPLKRKNIVAWRDGGGTLEIDRFHALLQGMDIAINATLTLDEEMQILAAGTITGRGMEKGVENLIRAHVLKIGPGLALIQILKQLQGESGQVTSAISVQNKFLYLNSLRLFALPPLSWSN